MKRLFFLSLLSTIILNACKESSPNTFELPPNATNLLAGDSVKTWKLAKRFNDGYRMNMGECFLSYRQSFKSDGTVKDNNEEQADCGESLVATWEIIEEKGEFFIQLTSDQIPQLLNIEENFKRFKIIELQEESLKLTFTHKQFSNKIRLIEDHLVPEDVIVPNRDFHH